MKKLLTQIGQVVDLRDTFAFTGLAMMGYGLYAIYPPAAWITIGIIVFWIGVRR